MNAIYLDHNATSPVDPQVRERMLACLDSCFGNPSSVHRQGQEARRAVDEARDQVAALIGAAPEEIIFTSGGTEADNLALIGACASGKRRGLVTSAIEHRAVLGPCQHLEQHGAAVIRIAPDGDGRVDSAAVLAAVDERTALVSLMLANNDLGTIQPVAELAEGVHARGALLHTDAVQAVGKIPLDVRQLGVDLLAISAHKLHGPKGVGALFARRGTTISGLIHGGRQEHRLRAGTENVPGIVGFGVACELACARLTEDSARLTAMRDHFASRVLAAIPDCRCYGATHPRLPNTVNLGFPGIDASRLVIALDLQGVSLSTGAACSAAEQEPSYVLLAMGRDEAEARSSLRVSFGRDNTTAEAEHAADLVISTVAQLRKKMS